MDKVLDKKWTKFWTKNWTNILETFGDGGRGRYASCGHAGGLSCMTYFYWVGVDGPLANIAVTTETRKTGQDKQHNFVTFIRFYKSQIFENVYQLFSISGQ